MVANGPSINTNTHANSKIMTIIETLKKRFLSNLYASRIPISEGKYYNKLCSVYISKNLNVYE